MHMKALYNVLKYVLTRYDKLLVSSIDVQCDDKFMDFSLKLITYSTQPHSFPKLTGQPS